jgi:hypothetical protein
VLKLRNQGAAAATIQLELLPLAGDTAEPATQSIEAGATVVITNPLQALWSRDETSAAIRITSDQPLGVTSECVVALPDGSHSVSAGLTARYEETHGTGSAADLLNFPVPETASTTIGVVFLVSGSIEVAAYNAEGAELARKTLESAAPGVQEFPAADWSATGSDVFRYEFSVTSGRIAAYLQTVDSTLNDISFAAASAEPTGGPLLTFVAPTQGAKVAVRFYNPNDPYYGISSTIQAAFYAPAGGDPLATAKFTIAPNTSKSVDDIVVDTFGLEPGTAGLVRLTASNAIVIQSRTASPGGQPRVTLSSAAALFLADPSQMIGLDPASSLGFTAGPSGASASLTLVDAAGQSVASAELALEPNTNSETTAAERFQVETVPQDAAVLVEVSSGSLSAYARTGKPGGTAVLQPARTSVESGCAAPYVDQFTSSAAFPAAPGSYELAWSVFYADSVTISGLGPVDPTGSATVDLKASNTYELKATGICGETIQTLEVAIGAPRLTAVTPASAKPGQTVKLTLANLAAADAVTGAQLTFPNGSTAVVQVVVEDGVPVFTVPLPRDAGGVTGDYVGGVAIAARLNDDSLTNSVNFAFVKGVYAGDAAADFRKWIDAKAEKVRDILTQLHDQPDLGPAMDVLLAGIDPDLAVLRKMADDIAATGSAVLPPFAATADYPNPQPVTITRADLESIMSLLMELTPAEEESPQAWKERVRAVGDAGPCLADDPQYAICYGIAQIDSKSLLARGWKAVGGFVDQIGNLFEKFSKNPYVIAFNRIRRLVGKAEFYCNIYPIYLDSFNARPFPDPVPVGGFREVKNDGTRVFALLKSRWTKEQAVDQLVQAARNFLLDGIINQDKKSSKELKDQAKKDADRMLDWLYQQTRNEVQNMANKLGVISTFREQQVYKCDIARMLPQGGNRNALLGRDERIEPEFQERGEYVYGFYGKEDGGLTYAQLTTFPNHFVELTPNVNAEQKRGVKGGVYGLPIEVGRGASTVKVTLTRVEERLGAPRTLIETYREFKVTDETRFDYNFATARSTFAFHVNKSGPSYKIQVAVSGSDSVGVQPQCGIQLSAKLRRQRGNRQRLRFVGNASGTSDAGYAGASMYLQNDGNGGNTSPKIDYAFPPAPLALNWNLTSTGARQASISIGVLGGGKSSNAYFNGTLTMPVP